MSKKSLVVSIKVDLDYEPENVREVAKKLRMNTAVSHLGHKIATKLGQDRFQFGFSLKDQEEDTP